MRGRNRRLVLDQGFETFDFCQGLISLELFLTKLA